MDPEFKERVHILSRSFFGKSLRSTKLKRSLFVCLGAVLFLVALFTFQHASHPLKSSPESSIPQIDLVYTWVNGSDEEWRKSKEEWRSKMFPLHHVRSISSDARFVEHDELKFSLRSAYINLPWIHHIYIVTNGQVPSWLNTSHPKITIVPHAQIMPKTSLPTFNSEAIELTLHNIKPLSELFIYANDDFFFPASLPPSYFFTDTGKAIIRVGQDNISAADEARNIYYANIAYSARLMATRFGTDSTYVHIHNSVPYIKSLLQACSKEFPKDFYNTIHNRFRHRFSVQRHIFAYYMDLRGRVEKIPNKHDGIQDSLVLWINPTQNIVRTVRQVHPNLLCINDRDSADPSQRAQLTLSLAELFPVKAPWELY